MNFFINFDVFVIFLILKDVLSCLILLVYLLNIFELCLGMFFVFFKLLILIKEILIGVNILFVDMLKGLVLFLLLICKYNMIWGDLI